MLFNKYQGGGISGLAAFVELQELGINEIILIEACDRLGGRINTVKFGKYLFGNFIKGNF